MRQLMDNCAGEEEDDEDGEGNFPVTEDPEKHVVECVGELLGENIHPEDLEDEDEKQWSHELSIAQEKGKKKTYIISYARACQIM